MKPRIQDMLKEATSIRDAEIFRLREELDSERTTLKAKIIKLEEALAKLLRYAESKQCQHEEIHRAGFIWTICNMCGKKWADDEGGFQPSKEPEVFEQARIALQGEGLKANLTQSRKCKKKQKKNKNRRLAA